MTGKKKLIRNLGILAAIVLTVFGIYHFHSSTLKKERTYDIVGTYIGSTDEASVYFVFDKKGNYCLYAPPERSVLIDKGTYETHEHGIITLESSMEQNHTVVSSAYGLYDFNADSGRVFFFRRITKDVFYITMHS